MKTATLHLTLDGGRITFGVSSGGQVRQYPGPEIKEAQRLYSELGQDEYRGPDQRARLLRRYAETFAPQDFRAWFQEWASDPSEDSVLCVYSSDFPLSALPWGALLLPSNVPPGRSWVARVASLTGAKPAPLPAAARILFAAWAKLGGYGLPGVEREIQQFQEKTERVGFKVRLLSDPTRAILHQECAASRPHIVHLSPPSLIREQGQLALPVTAPEPPGGTVYEAVLLADLSNLLKTGQGIRIIVLNACHAGVTGCGQLATELQAVAVGWPALVSDETAADFAFYFYQRLSEGQAPVAAVRSFAQHIWTTGSTVELPVVWLPSPDWVDWAVTPAPVSQRAAERPHGQPAGWEALVPPAVPVPPPAVVQFKLEFKPHDPINPALLTNQQHPIKHLGIDGPVAQTVHLCIVCDTGAGTSTYRKTLSLVTGTNSIPARDIHFPALHELIERKVHRRLVSFTASICDTSGHELAVLTQTAQWMGAQEWLNQPETWAYVPAFVNPLDEGVVTVFGMAKKVLRTLGHPANNFSGYLQPAPSNGAARARGRAQESADHVLTQMRAIYQTLRDDAGGLTYITPPGSPVFVPGRTRASGQLVRTHSEVLECRLGTCHDLALLLAACAEYVGIRPLIVLMPGHTFCGIWTAHQHQEKYWEARNARFPPIQFGDEWIISDGKDLLDLVRKKKVVLIEATYLCRPDKTFDEACKDRSVALRKRQEVDRMNVAVDVYAARRAVQPV